MASCSFSSLIDDESGCGQSSTATCVSLAECEKDICNHLNNMKVFADQKTDSEMKLILARAG